MFIEELVRFGLSEKEARIYLALLELEVATANEIAQTAEVNRSSTYVVLESLQKKGLVSVSAGRDVKQYVVAPPEILARLAERRAKEQADTRDEIAGILPDLKAMYKGTKQRPKVRILEGVEGIISSYEKTLESREKMLRVVSSAARTQKTLGEYLHTYIGKRIESGIEFRGIHPEEEAAYHLQASAPEHVHEHMVIPKEKWNFPCDFGIYDSTIACILYEERISIEIEDATIAKSMKSVFDLAFAEAKRINVIDPAEFQQ